VQGTQIAALDELRDLDDDERALAVTRLAPELAPELEALLVGSLVRGDDLAGVLVAPAATKPDDDRSPGWDAIDRALAALYHDVEPLHFGTVIPYMLGGNDPIHGISAYARTEPVPHWHFVTYGFTDLFQKENDDPETSGFGFELTFRLRKTADEATPPTWALNFLQNLGRYVFGTGNGFAAGHKMGLNGPIALDLDTQITAICFADDPELGGEIESEHGLARFVQIVGITDDEYKLIQEWSTPGLIDALRGQLPLLVTDLARSSVLANPQLAAEIQQRVAKEGSSEDLTFAGELGIEIDDGRVRISLGALYAATLPRAMRGRIRHGRPYELRGRNASLHLRPGPTAAYHREGTDLALDITQELATELEHELRQSLAGSYTFDAWPALEIVISPSFIRAQSGEVTDVRGVADPEEARRMIAAENARLAAATGDEEEENADHDDDLAEEGDEDGDDDDAPPAVEKVTAALAMTRRALRLAPADTDVQFTHAMLLLDADRAGLSGQVDELIGWLPRCAPSVRINVAVRMGGMAHARFSDAVDVALGEPLPDKIIADRTTSLGGGAAIASFGDVAHELFSDLADAVLAHAPAKLTKLAPLLPDDVNLLSELAYKSVQGSQREVAITLYDRVLALPIPDDGDERTNYLRALNNACVQAHAAKAFDAAVRIADRAQPVAHENPYIFHSAACAYAAVGDYHRAFEQVKLAVSHDYDHLPKVETDSDLGPILEWPEFKALFRDWRARQEGN
jgi:tetratricopeptide (TPR) repeat protein